MFKYSQSVYFVWFLTLLLLLAFMINLSFAQLEPLRVTVLTDKFSYQLREIVNIYGNVTYEDNPVGEGLVAVQVRYPNGTTITVRTVPAGTVPSASWFDVEIISFISCDAAGNPKNNFYRDSMAYFWMIAKNTKPFDITCLLTMSIHDIDQTPIQIVWHGPITVPPDSEEGFLIGIPIPTWASTGTGMAYANVHSDWPYNEGWPRCPEKNTTFNIIEHISMQTSSSNAAESHQLSENGNGAYQAAFRLLPEVPRGSYLISVSAWRFGECAYASVIFTVDYRMLGDVAPPWGRIDIYDVVMVTSIYGVQSGDPLWNPLLDLFHDGKIDIYDVVIVTSKYGTTY